LLITPLLVFNVFSCFLFGFSIGVQGKDKCLVVKSTSWDGVLGYKPCQSRGLLLLA